MVGYVKMVFLQSLSYSACKEIFLPVMYNGFFFLRPNAGHSHFILEVF
jgi:hypothetical protein